MSVNNAFIYATDKIYYTLGKPQKGGGVVRAWPLRKNNFFLKLEKKTFPKKYGH